AREGLMGLAFGSRDNVRTQRWLAEAGFHPDGPKDLKRALELPSGDAMAAFKLVFVPPDETPGLSAFFCQHLSPELVRWPGYLLHANKAVALETVIAVVDRPAEFATAYRRLFGAAAVSAEDYGLRVATGEGEVWFVTRDELARLYPAIDLPRHPTPWLAAMRISVLILADTVDYLDWKKVKILPTGRGVAVPPEFAAGTIVEFVTAQPS
ncbi:MAG: VOC family protein, partial [Dongiaceae bacterium]